jgi:hypothetical protein
MWDPGRESEDPNEREQLFKIKVPYQLYTLIATASAVNTDDDGTGHEETSRTELDSHANMPVVGRHAYIISDTGRVADVSPFTPDYSSMKIKVVDAAVQYDCQYTGTSYILVVRNALHVPSMKHNLLPPFVLRQVGMVVNDTPKIHVAEPTIDDHSLMLPETGFRIPLSLYGVFSYFATTKPTVMMMQESEEVYMLTPTNFNPHDDAYAANEESMMDWEGNMIEKQHRTQIILSDIEEDESMRVSSVISSIESRTIDQVLDNSDVSEEKLLPSYKPIPRAADEISSVLASISPIFDDVSLYEHMSARSEVGKFKASIGSTDATSSEYLVEDDDTVVTDPSTDASDNDESDNDDDEHARLLDEIYTRSTKGEIDLDDFLVSAAHARRTQGMDAAHLSKVWRISSEPWT